MTLPNGSTKFPDEIYVFDIIATLWARKLFIAGTALFFCGVSICFALTRPDIYRAEALLSPAENNQSGLFSSISASNVGISALSTLGVSAAPRTSDVDVALAKMQSRAFITAFIERHDILPDLFAAKSYDLAEREVVYDEQIFDGVSGELMLSEGEITAHKSYRKFIDLLNIDQRSDTGFIVVSIDHVSPDIASSWVSKLISDINKEMMLQATSEATQAIDFLTSRLQSTRVVALEQVFYSLIEEQTKRVMLADARPEYLFETIDPAVSTDIPVSPNRLLIVIAATFLGGMCSVVYVLAKKYMPT